MDELGFKSYIFALDMLIRTAKDHFDLQGSNFAVVLIPRLPKPFQKQSSPCDSGNIPVISHPDVIL